MLSLNPPARGQIGLIPHGVNWFQRTIEAVTHSPVHHVVTATGDGRVISPEIPTVRYRPAEHFPDAVWSAFPLTTAQADRVVTYGESQIGKRYALGDDLLIGLELELGVHAPTWLSRLIAGDGRWQCAELADVEYRRAGCTLFPDRSPASVFPGSFVPIWKSHGWWPAELH